VEDTVAKTPAERRRCGAPGCSRPLSGRQRRFCSELCRRRGQRAERVTEDADYSAATRRMVTAQGKRAGTDLAVFAMFAQSVDFARAQLQDAADRIIAQGYSYADLGAALGITRQGAWKRFGRQPKVGSQAGNQATS
jgi:hypothetical protein